MLGNDQILKNMPLIKTQISDHLLSATPQIHEKFYSQLGLTNQNRLDFMIECIANYEATIKIRPMIVIPNFIHRMWLTDYLSPKYPSEDYSKRIFKQAIRLGKNFNYIFWHNSDEVANYMKKNCFQDTYECRHIADLTTDTILYEKISNAILERKYVMAGDIAKHTIIKEFGGIYADMGVDFGQDLIDLINGSTVSLFMDSNVFFQPALMAAPSNFSAFEGFCEFLKRPELITAAAYSRDKIFNPGTEIHAHGGVSFSALLMATYDRSYSILPIPPNRGLLHHQSQGSWYKPGGKFGNVTLDAATVTHLDHDKHRNLFDIYEKLKAETNINTGYRIIRTWANFYRDKNTWIDR